MTVFIVAKDASNPPAEEEIIVFCRERLAGFKRPRSVCVILAEEMPRTGSGKVLHRVLRERYGSHVGGI